MPTGTPAGGCHACAWPEAYRHVAADGPSRRAQQPAGRSLIGAGSAELSSLLLLLLLPRCHQQNAMRRCLEQLLS
jgi:hypothetical protein